MLSLFLQQTQINNQSFQNGCSEASSLSLVVDWFQYFYQLTFLILLLSCESDWLETDQRNLGFYDDQSTSMY